MTYQATERIDNFFVHHGILGQKWGRRRYQNPDGSLTPEGRKRYGTHGPGKLNRKEIWNEHNRVYSDTENRKKKYYAKLANEREKLEEKYIKTDKNGERYYDDEYWSESSMEKRRDLERNFFSEKNKSSQAADEYILKKYGTVGLKKVKNQNQINLAEGLATFGIVVGTPIALIKGVKHVLKK